MIRLEELTPDAHVEGIEPAQTVTVVQVKAVGADALQVVYKRSDGSISERMLFRGDEGKLELAEAGRAWSLDADPNDFKLAAEALRIRLAHLFDPMMAIHTSNVDPLPHQITAVYESMLPRQPLRYLLADDPGSGKTIMAGLLMRELLVRGDLKRCMVVAPGSLVEQWQDELHEKFDLHFHIMSRQMVEESATGNPFAEYDRLICRVDQLSRGEDLQDKLFGAEEWDLVIVDEAHKLSAHWYGNEKKETKRYQLGVKLGGHTRNFLLMTATPHNGKEEDFQLFLALLDSDRFYGKYRQGAHQVDTSDLMRRMVKEKLVKFDGTPLFPERRAYTVNYDLSDEENALYHEVTAYVRDQMGRADDLEEKRRGTVGFALTILQRRLASSPAAIHESLKRRRNKLIERKREAEMAQRGAEALKSGTIDVATVSPDEMDDFLDDYSAEELEKLEEELVDAATTATNLPELEAEIQALERLEKQALRVRNSGKDKKWEELSRLLQDAPEMFREDGSRRKMIVFTEHKDTLNYLADGIRGVLGSHESVGVISGSVKRENRRNVQERFWHDPSMVVLVATDAAGEGVNLQNANLMVNYDLPWNPNRLEQRFGRIHRIGQEEVCHLWNIVAFQTREGAVFQRLLEKIEVQSKALEGQVFNVLGDAFNETSLRDMLIEAIRYGELSEVKAKLNEQLDVFLDTENLKALIERNALGGTIMGREKLFDVKEQLEAAEARKLQPLYVYGFFSEAFRRLGGELREKEKGRYAVPHVPPAIRANDRMTGSRQAVLEKYNRVCFERELVRAEGKGVAALLHPGHPLVSATLNLTSENLNESLQRGTVLVDPTDYGTEPRLLFLIDHQIKEAGETGRLASRRLHMVEIDETGAATSAGHAPYLDYKPLPPEAAALADEVRRADWLQTDLEDMALSHAVNELAPEHFEEVRGRRERYVDKTMSAVQERLVKEINFWSARVLELEAAVQAGKQPKLQPIMAKRRAEELTVRLETRKKELEQQRELLSKTPLVMGGALVIPQGLVDQHLGTSPTHSIDPVARKKIEQLAMNAVMEKEAALGNRPEDVGAKKLGWDVTSKVTEDLTIRHIEVKGRAKGADEITLTYNEISTGYNNPDHYFLAIVLIDEDDKPEGPYYIRSPFPSQPEPWVASQSWKLAPLIERATIPSSNQTP